MAQCMEMEIEQKPIEISMDSIKTDTDLEPGQESSDEHRGASLANPSWTMIAAVILLGAGLIFLYFYAVAAVHSSFAL